MDTVLSEYKLLMEQKHALEIEKFAKANSEFNEAHKELKKQLQDERKKTSELEGFKMGYYEKYRDSESQAKRIRTLECQLAEEQKKTSQLEGYQKTKEDLKLALAKNTEVERQNRVARSKIQDRQA